MNLTQEPTTKVTTCAECPFARHIDGNRYCCTESATAQDTVRGHWEPRTDCLSLLESIAPELIEVELIEVEPIAPQRETPAPAPAPAPAPQPMSDSVQEATPTAAAKVSTKKLLPAIVAVKRIYSEVPAANFDRHELEIAGELSLAIGGFYNPPVVRRDGSNYQVIAGHFQYHAAVLARQLNPKAGETIPAIIIEPNNEAALLAQIEMLKFRRFLRTDRIPSRKRQKRWHPFYGCH